MADSKVDTSSISQVNTSSSSDCVGVAKSSFWAKYKFKGVIDVKDQILFDAFLTLAKPIKRLWRRWTDDHNPDYEESGRLAEADFCRLLIDTLGPSPDVNHWTNRDRPFPFMETSLTEKETKEFRIKCQDWENRHSRFWCEVDNIIECEDVEAEFQKLQSGCLSTAEIAKEKESKEPVQMWIVSAAGECTVTMTNSMNEAWRNAVVPNYQRLVLDATCEIRVDRMGMVSANPFNSASVFVDQMKKNKPIPITSPFFSFISWNKYP